VVDLSRVLAGPYCTMLLADLGARVIKVEHPDGGDDARQLGPFVEGRSAYFMSANRDKESIALDLKQSEDRAVFDAMLARADVLVENFRPGVIARLGYDWDALHTRHPRLVFASISGFGQTGPYRSLPAYDMVVQAMGGIMSITGHPGAPPTRVGTSIGDLSAGMFAVIGIQAALLRRHASGLGERVDIGMLDCQVALLENAIARYEVSGEVPGPIGARHPAITPFDLFRASDGYIVIAAGRDLLFKRMCDALELSDLPTDPRFADAMARSEHHAALKELIEHRLAAGSCVFWRNVLTDAGVPTGPYNTLKEVVVDPQVLARGMLMKVGLPSGQTMRVAGNPIKFGDAEREAATANEVHRVPELDADRAALLREFGEHGRVS
jgi:CoA:oxalate CoA-transferase